MSLDKDWLYYFASNPQNDYSQPDVNEAGWIPLPEISDWTVANSAHTGVDWFRRHFTLMPMDGCVRYLLQIEVVPENLTVYINGKKVSDTRTKQDFKADVTDYVTLDENIIALRLTPRSNNAGGSFEKIGLQPIPCE